METTRQIIKRIKHHVEAEFAKQNIICPVCHHVWDPEGKAPHVSMWGEDPAKEDECPRCGTKLIVKENVVRTFEVTMDKVSE